MRTLVVAVLVVAPLLARAQTEAELKIIDAWLLGSGPHEARKEAAVVQLLDRKPALAKGMKDGQPLLAHALDSVGVRGDIGRRAKKLAGLLIAKGADVQAKVDGQPLIVRFAVFARVEAMEILLSHKARPDAVDKDARGALHWLATMNEIDREPHIVQQKLKAATLMLDRKAKIDLKDKWGRTPLAIAAFVGAKRMAQLLIGRGADINAKDKDGYSVLGSCRLRVEGGPGKPTFAGAKEKDATREVIKLLVAKGARDERPKR